MLRPKLVLLLITSFKMLSLCFCFYLPCLRSTASFVLPFYQNSCGTSHYTTQTIQVRWTKHTGHSWRSKDKLIGEILRWNSIYGQTNVGWLTKIYIYQYCADTGCWLEELPRAMRDQGNPCYQHNEDDDDDICTDCPFIYKIP